MTVLVKHVLQCTVFIHCNYSVALQLDVQRQKFNSFECFISKDASTLNTLKHKDTAVDSNVSFLSFSFFKLKAEIALQNFSS